MSQCIAKANLARCAGCFGFPLVALTAYAWKVSWVGDDAHSYLSRILTGGLPLISALLVFGGCITWALVTWPKAVTALRHRDCAITLDDQRLSIYDNQIARADIAAVDTVKRPFDVVLRIQRKDGSNVARSIVLLSPAPNGILRALREEGL